MNVFVSVGVESKSQCRCDTDSLRPVGVAVKRISISDRDVSDWSTSPLQSDPMSMKFNNTL